MPSTTAPSSPSLSRSSATHALTLADLERVLELRDNRFEFAQTERDVMLGKLISYAVAKPFPEPSHELFRRLQESSSIDDLIAALEKEIVGGPHPAVVAGGQQADAFAARARADLLERELRETMKRVSQLEESEETASALVRSLKEQVAQLENRNTSLQELHQSTNLERDSWSTQRIRLDATIRDKEQIIASMTADYHRDAGNLQLVLGRCYVLTAQVRQLSDAVAMGNNLPTNFSSTSSLTRTTRFVDPSARFACPQWSANLNVAALSWSWLQCSVSLRVGARQFICLLTDLVRSRSTDARSYCCRAKRFSFGGRDASSSRPCSEVLGEAVAVSSSCGHGRQASSGSAAVSSTFALPPSFQVTSTSPTQASQDSIVDLASVNSPVSSSMLAEDLEGLTRLVVGVPATSPNLSNKLVESSDSSGDESTLADPSKSQSGSAAGFGSPPLASPTVAVRPPHVTTKLAASDTKARAKSDGGVPPHHDDVKVLVARAAASARLDSRESGPMKRLRELPFFHQGSKRCWEKIMIACAVSVIVENTADGEQIKPTPCSIAGLAAFMDVDDSGHPWRSRSKKPGSLLEVLSHEWCNSRGVVREDIFLALWERMHWIVESSVNVWLAEAFLDSERTSRIDYEFTPLWKSLEDYLLGRKQRSDLLRLTVKVLGDAVVGAANHNIDGLPAPLVDTEVCFDPAIPFCPPVNLPWFPRAADLIAEAVRIDNHEPWRLWWLTAPGHHPYNTISRLYHPEFPLFVPEGADSEMVVACVEDERLIAEPDPPALHPNTPAPVNRPGEIEFCPPNIVHSA
ncbi:unnamed protein product [Phytophthora fragariaefolia]|uniref:Unnamed protein product n=1 Tax=Phytophthora fragariaefolia TaxID=1490495 RepID=A0A9W6Y8Z5_9STRA|nr:unnamed protein product [Phytophthora fragariaefolia]